MKARLHSFRHGGFSVVELLVGVAIGLFIIGGGIKLFVDALQGNRRLLLETRVNQELRAAADIVARDLRRSGYWTQSLTGVVWPAATNPNNALALSVANSASQATYTYDGAGITGIRVSGAGALQAQVGGNWQDLTDTGVVLIPTNGTGFSITPDIQPISLGGNCTPACALGSPGCPVLNVRRYIIRIRGTSTDGTVVRQIEEAVRVRNDQIANPSCP